MSDGTTAAAGVRTARELVGRSKDPVLNEDNPFEAMMARFDHAAEPLDLDPRIYRVLREPEKQVIVAVPVQRDNAEIEVQDRAGYFWDEPTVVERLHGVLQRSFHDVLSVARRHQVNLRTPAYMLSVERVAAVHRLRGMYA